MAKSKRSSKRKTGRAPKQPRAVSRVPVNLRVYYRLFEDFQVDLAQDISPGGIFIKTKTPLPRGTSVELSFADGDKYDKPRMTVEGKVVWSQLKSKDHPDRFGMGIEFTRIDFEGQKYIDNIINDFLRKLSIK